MQVKHYSGSFAFFQGKSTIAPIDDAPLPNPGLFCSRPSAFVLRILLPLDSVLPLSVTLLCLRFHPHADVVPSFNHSQGSSLMFLPYRTTLETEVRVQATVEQTQAAVKRTPMLSRGMTPCRASRNSYTSRNSHEGTKISSSGKLRMVRMPQKAFRC